MQQFVRIRPFMEKIISLDPASSSLALLKAAKVLENGGLVALPTDTIYGISSLLEHSQKIYDLKQRPMEKPLGLFISDASMIKKYSHQTIPDALLKKLIPGPVTLVFERSHNLPRFFNPGISNIGFRIPEHPFVQELCRKFPDQPLAQTSANMSGSNSPLCIEDFKELWNELDLIIDGGHINGSRMGSTVVDLSIEGEYRIIREGCFTPFLHIPSPTMVFWKNAGITYLRYSQIAAQVTRSVVKKTGKDAVKPSGSLRIQKWDHGKPVKATGEK